VKITPKKGNDGQEKNFLGMKFKDIKEEHDEEVAEVMGPDQFKSR
jgi:hypothetical protein